MPKRVSLKGRGADLFFGEESPPSLHDNNELLPPAALEDQGSSTDQVLQDMLSESSAGSASDIATPTKQQTRSRSKGRAVGRSEITSSPVDIDVIEAIRQIVKVPGREVSYVRLTAEEKARLSDVIYTFKRQGQKTTETEINRIALNYLLNDYDTHGEKSLLARVIAALSS